MTPPNAPTASDVGIAETEKLRRCDDNTHYWSIGDDPPEGTPCKCGATRWHATAPTASEREGEELTANLSRIASHATDYAYELQALEPQYSALIARLANALDRATDALLAARRGEELTEKRARYAEAALREIDRPITSIDGARQIVRNYFAGWEAVMGDTPNQEKQ